MQSERQGNWLGKSGNINKNIKSFWKLFRNEKWISSLLVSGQISVEILKPCAGDIIDILISSTVENSIHLSCSSLQQIPNWTWWTRKLCRKYWHSMFLFSFIKQPVLLSQFLNSFYLYHYKIVIHTKLFFINQEILFAIMMTSWFDCHQTKTGWGLRAVKSNLILSLLLLDRNPVVSIMIPRMLLTPIRISSGYRSLWCWAFETVIPFIHHRK